MAALNELIQKIENPELRAQIQAAADKLAKQKKFGLVFEEHLPECTPLYDIPVKKGAKVALKTGKVSDFYTVLKIEDEKALCLSKERNETAEFAVEDLVCIAEFGEPIYPYLQPLDAVCNAPDSDLWHTLIEADNYHALQLLEYLYAGKVDCIYIDPPYNTGARDWKYNNDYVDGNDTYRHSKWLSFMQKRLKLAKRLLNPQDSVLIVTIDEKEYLHLGCLLEEMFPEARMQMVSSIINPKGVSSQSGFRRADEYLFFVMLGASGPAALPLGNEWSPSAIRAAMPNVQNTDKHEPGWTSMMRRGSHSARSERPGLFYPIYADPLKHAIVQVGETIPNDRNKGNDIEGLTQILPIRTNGDFGCWQVGPDELRRRLEQGRVRLGRETAYGFVVNYLPDGEYEKVLSGIYVLEGRANDGSLIAYSSGEASSNWVAPTQWKIASHDASAYGSGLIGDLFAGKRFAFPKSLYAEQDTIRFFVANKPNALIVDFFAGSGTTLHAVNLLNAEDGGHRRCIMVTNNEVSADEAKSLTVRGFHPGDAEWEKLGIARYVTWPRTVCSIEGHDVNGQPLKGNYLGSDLPMADGFKANAIFFKLGFLDKTEVSLGRQFNELLPTLWMKAGAHGPCPRPTFPVKSKLQFVNWIKGGRIGPRPTLEKHYLPPMLLLPENRMAVLNDENCFGEFAERIAEHPEIDVVYLVTDYEAGFAAMTAALPGKTTYQLYRDYLDNFRINAGRNAR